MATVTERDKERLPGKAPEERVRPGKPSHRQHAARRRRARWRWLAGVLVVLVVFVWLLPTIVAHSPVSRWIVRSLAADLKGEVTARSASLGWLSSPRLVDIEIRDQQGQPVLEIAEARSDRSLLALVWNSSNLGRIRLARPTLRVVLRQDGSNVEDVLDSYLAASREPSWPIDVALEIVDGKVSLSDARTQKAWEIEAFQLALTKPADPDSPLEMQASGTVADAEHPGRFAVKMKMHGSATGTPTPSGPTPERPTSDNVGSGPMDELLVNTEDVPLAMFESLLDRFAMEIRPAGRVSSDVQCRWSRGAAPAATVLQGSLTANDLALTASSLGSDQVEMERVQATGKVAWQAGRVQVDQLAIHSDAGSASLVGSFDLHDGETAGLLARLPKQTFEMTGRLDLARLAALLPDTLRIREGTQVTSGQLEMTASSRRGPEGMSWQGRIEATDLAATNQGRRLVWHQPVRVELTAHESPQGPIVESLQCDSDFLKLHASGTPEQLDASASFNLNRLAGQLGQLVDLGGVRLAGEGWAQFNWQRSDAEAFQTDGKLEVRNFELALSDRPSWTEETLNVSLSATGRTDFTSDTRVDTATVTLDAGRDRLEARLAQPVLDLRNGGVWPVEVRSTAALSRWARRISPWTTFNDWSLAGSCELVAQVTGSAAAIQVRHGQLAVRELQVQGPGWLVREPKAELAVSGSWQPGRRRLELASAALASSSVSAQATGVVCTFPQEGLPELAGAVTYQGTIERLRQWTIDPSQPPAWHVLGQFAGNAELRHTGGTTAAAFEMTVNDLIATHQSGQQFHEPEIRFSGQGTYDPQQRLIQLHQAALSGGTAGLRAAGQIALEDQQTDVQLSGQLDYDMEKLSQLLSSYVGEGVRFSGRGSSPIRYQGPLALETAQASAGLSWTRGELYGFRVARGELAASLSGGMLQIRPLDLAVSEGQMRLASQVRLAPEPKELFIQPGRVAEQVRINPRMCAALLQYIAPVLAGVATAEGRFSMELDSCRIPLADPARGELAGRMIIHSAEIGPGPLVYEMAVLLGRATPAQLTRESVIPFHMVDGRVYHRDLVLVFPDLIIRTYGSVGLDQSLALMAEMPIPPKWRGKHEMLDSALRDQLIRVPIGGTLAKPKIDRNTLDQLSQQFLENAARNVLQDGINRGLERLLAPPPQIR